VHITWFLGVCSESFQGFAYIIFIKYMCCLYCKPLLRVKVFYWYSDPFRRQADKQLPEARTGVGTSVVTGCNLSPHSGCSSTNSEAAMTATWPQASAVC
jgi:hypothetical protein